MHWEGRALSRPIMLRRLRYIWDRTAPVPPNPRKASALTWPRITTELKPASFVGRSVEQMKAKLPVLIVLLLLAPTIAALAQPSAGGIVYGPKGAFNLSAPKGWKLDPTAGSSEGLPCVLYPDGATWETADPLMYAKIATTSYEDCEAFAKDALADMKKTRPGFTMKRVAAGKTAGGETYFINEYLPTATYKRFERVAYVQLPKAVAYIVFSADKKEAYEKQQGALEEAVKSLRSTNVDYPGKPK